MFIQGNGAFATGTAASISVAFGSNVTSGNTLLVVGGEDSAWTGTFSDTQANSYTQDVTADFGASAGASIERVQSASAGATTVTSTPSASSWLTIGIAEFSDIAATPLDDTDSDAAFGASSSLSATTTEADVCICATSVFYGVTSWDSAPSGYTEIFEGNSGGNSAISWQYKIQVSSGSETPAFGWTGSNSYVALFASYKQTSGGTTHQLAGSVDSQSALTGLLNLTQRLSASLNSSSHASGVLRLIQRLSGSLNSSSVVSGTIRLIHGLAGAVSSISALVGNLRLIQRLSGTVESHSHLTGNLSAPTTHSLSGSVQSHSHLTGTLTEDRIQEIILASGTRTLQLTGSGTRTLQQTGGGTRTLQFTASGTKE